VSQATFACGVLYFGCSFNSTAADRHKGHHCGSLTLGLFSVIRAFVLVILAAVLVNAQCYNTCTTADAHATESSSTDTCHHHPKTPPSDGVCHHQHPSVAGPENGTALSNMHAAAATTFISIVTTQYFPACERTGSGTLIQGISPPRFQISPGLTILRV
jgi:hypothetical protein